MKVTLHLDLTSKEEWKALIQVEDPSGTEDASEMSFAAPKAEDGLRVPYAFTGMFRTLDLAIQRRIWPDELTAAIEEARAAAMAEEPRIIIPE